MVNLTTEIIAKPGHQDIEAKTAVLSRLGDNHGKSMATDHCVP